MSGTAYLHTTILDGTKNMIAKPDHGILVENDKIKAVLAPGELPSGADVIDLQGGYLMPGLINLHCHLPGSGKPSKISGSTGSSIQKGLRSPIGRFFIRQMCTNAARTELLSGVTTLRTVGGLGTVDSQIRDKINQSEKAGPRILAADTAITVPGGHMAGTMATTATSIGQVIDLVKEISKTKPDLIKLMITGGVLDADKPGAPGALRMPPEYVKAACDTAHGLGFPVAAHVESPVGVRVALENGVDTIEHGAFLDEELVHLFHKVGAKLVCTISPTFPMTSMDVKQLPDENYRINGQIVQEGIVQAAKTALERGISVGLGNDVGCPYVTHYDFWRELEYFHHFVGASRFETLHIATEENARIIGLDAVTGTIAPGKSADFIVCRKDPLEGFEALRQLEWVVIKGNAIQNPKPKHILKIDALLDTCTESIRNGFIEG